MDKPQNSVSEHESPVAITADAESIASSAPPVGNGAAPAANGASPEEEGDRWLAELETLERHESKRNEEQRAREADERRGDGTLNTSAPSRPPRNARLARPRPPGPVASRGRAPGAGGRRSAVAVGGTSTKALSSTPDRGRCGRLSSAGHTGGPSTPAPRRRCRSEPSPKPISVGRVGKPSTNAPCVRPRNGGRGGGADDHALGEARARLERETQRRLERWESEFERAEHQGLQRAEQDAVQRRARLDADCERALREAQLAAEEEARLTRRAVGCRVRTVQAGGGRACAASRARSAAALRDRVRAGRA